jgi:hypothetical protein
MSVYSGAKSKAPRPRGIGPEVVPDRTNVKNGDLVNFAVISRNVSSRVASSKPSTAMVAVPNHRRPSKQASKGICP